jgi:DNA invertase Pin-like site-specific DNA recombinase
MTAETYSKVKANHLKRNAYLYVRQSTIRQVFENTESTKRQYDLRQKAIALGWPEDRIIVIDSDMGHSGASAADREGFKRLVTETGMGRAGIILGLEVSRLARNSTDWHRLLEIAALSDTLILDEDGIYDPAHFNDRLLLGLKGTMSEAELHVLRARLQGGILNKASRGELATPVPVGLVYNSEDKVILDPDKQVQQSLRLFFETFERIGSATGTVRSFRRQGLLFPRRIRTGQKKGQLVWAELVFSQALRILHNPRYAGVFVFGRSRSRRRVDGSTSVIRLPRDEWHTMIPGAHAGYISLEQYDRNQKRLQETAQAHGADRRRSPPREGPALLQGLVVCGACGNRMTVRYHTREGQLWPEYVCQQFGIEHGKQKCQEIPGKGIDQAIGNILMESVSPMALEVALAVQEELQSQLQEADRLRQKQVERARYEAELAQRHYFLVDPENRLVAATLEAEWNDKLRTLAEAQREYERQRKADRMVLDEKQRAAILSLATDFPRLWQDPKTPNRERKRMVRLMIEDVTLLRQNQIVFHIRFRGGTRRTVTLPLPLQSWQQWTTSPEVVAEIDRLLNHHTEGQIANILNKRGCRSGKGKPFNRLIVARLRRTYALKNRLARLREMGMLTQREMADLLGISTYWVRIWRDHRLLTAHAYNDKNECLYEHPGENPPRKMQGRKLCDRRPFVVSNRTDLQ